MARKKLKTYYVLAPNGTMEWFEGASKAEAVVALFDPADYDTNDQFLVFCADDATEFHPNYISEFKEGK
jgi:hypothetical protein